MDQTKKIVFIYSHRWSLYTVTDGLYIQSLMVFIYSHWWSLYTVTDGLYIQSPMVFIYSHRWSLYTVTDGLYIQSPMVFIYSHRWSLYTVTDGLYIPSVRWLVEVQSNYTQTQQYLCIYICSWISCSRCLMFIVFPKFNLHRFVSALISSLILHIGVFVGEIRIAARRFIWRETGWCSSSTRTRDKQHL